MTLALIAVSVVLAAGVFGWLMTERAHRAGRRDAEGDAAKAIIRDHADQTQKNKSHAENKQAADDFFGD